ncbi:hypothetical protein D3C83_71560 [compost metagenome]
MPVQQVPIAPERLWHAEYERKKEGVRSVCRGRDEEGPVDEVVRDGVGVPPEANRNHDGMRHEHNNGHVCHREGDKPRVFEAQTRGGPGCRNRGGRHDG